MAQTKGVSAKYGIRHPRHRLLDLLRERAGVRVEGLYRSRSLVILERTMPLSALRVVGGGRGGRAVLINVVNAGREAWLALLAGGLDEAADGRAEKTITVYALV